MVDQMRDDLSPLTEMIRPLKCLGCRKLLMLHMKSAITGSVLHIRSQIVQHQQGPLCNTTLLECAPQSNVHKQF